MITDPHLYFYSRIGACTGGGGEGPAWSIFSLYVPQNVSKVPQAYI